MTKKYSRNKTKQVLFVVKDNVEFRNFITWHETIVRKSKGMERYITMPLIDNKDFRARYRKIFQNINVVDWETPQKSQRYLYHARLLIYFISSVSRSYSSRQKLLSYFHVSKRIILSWKGLLRAKLPNLRFLMYLVEIIDKLNFDRKQKSESFDYVVFFRSDSVNNISFFKRYVSPSTKVVTIIRNIDTVYLKGPFSVPTDVTFVSTRDEKRFLIENHSRTYYGRIIVTPYKPVMGRGNSESTYGEAGKILYACSHPDFVPNEDVIVEKIASITPRNKVLDVRPHSHNYIPQTENSSKIHVLINNIISFNGGRHKYFSLDDMEQYYQKLSEYRYVICCTSTIAVDARRAGVKNVYYIRDNKYVQFPLLYEREHLMCAISNWNINVIDDIESIDFIVSP